MISDRISVHASFQRAVAVRVTNRSHYLHETITAITVCQGQDGVIDADNYRHWQRKNTTETGTVAKQSVH